MQSHFARPKALSTTTYPIYVFEVSSSLGNSKCQVISVHSCRKCDGSGTISGKRNYEKVDYGIYYKYTSSGTVSFTDLCGECKGNAPASSGSPIVRSNASFSSAEIVPEVSFRLSSA